MTDQADDDARVLDALRRMGRVGGYELSRELSMRSGRIYPALQRLLEAGLIEDQWVDQPDGRPARRLYVPSAEREGR